MYRILKKLLCLFLPFISFYSIFALEFAHINTESGLQSNSVSAIKRDSHGFVWIGTLDGLSRFDGKNITNYQLFNSDSERIISRINEIIQIDNWNLRLATNDGVFSYSYISNRITPFYKDESSVICMIDLEIYEVWGTSKGLIFYSKEKKRNSRILNEEYIVAIQKVENKLIILTTNALYKLSVEKDFSFRVETIFKNDSLEFSALVVFGNSFYVGTKRHGVFVGNFNKGLISQMSDIKARIITSMMISDEKLYIATDGSGIIIHNMITKNTNQYLHQKSINESLCSNSIKCIEIDEFKTLWAGSYSMGISYIQPSITFIEKLHFSDGYSARCFERIDNKRYLIGTREGLLYYNDEILSRFSIDNHPKMRSDIILSIEQFSEHEYLIGTYGGGVFMLNIENNSINNISFSEKLKNILIDESIYGIKLLGKNLYFFTLSGLFVYSNDTVKLFDSKNSDLPSSLIYSYVLDEKSNVFWIGTLNGICRYDIVQEKIFPFIIQNSENKFRTNVMYIDNQSNLWIDKNYVELLKINTHTTVAENIEFKGSNLKHISGIIQDNNQTDFWISTTDGLYCYDIQNKQHFRLSKSHGLSSQNFCPNSILKLGDNTFYWGSEDGIYTYKPKKQERLPIESKVFITDVFINGKESDIIAISNGRKKDINSLMYIFKLKWDDHVNINIVDPSFYLIDGKRYVFRIPHIVDEWTLIENKTISLHNLTLGNHLLMIKVANEYNEWGNEIKAAIIKVRPNYTSSTFMIIYFLLGISIIIGMFWKMKKIIIQLRNKIIERDFIRKYTKKEVDDEKANTIIHLIRNFLTETEAYKSPHFSLKDLSNLTSIPLHDISMVLNNKLHMNFSEFINEYRINAIKSLLEKDDANYYILHVLAEKCGFNSKTSFYRIFKAKTGLTPLEYRKKILDKTHRDSEN